MYAETTVRRVLSNGAVILLEKVHGGNSVVIGVGFKFGSRNDQVDKRGGAHLCEHMIVRMLNHHLMKEGFSGYKIQGSTEREEIYFSLRFLKSDLFTYLDSLFRFVENFCFMKHDFESEKKVVMEEVLISESSEVTKLDNAFIKHVFGGSSLAFPTYGVSSDIENIVFQDVKELLHFLNLENVIIAVTGEIDCSSLEETLVGYISCMDDIYAAEVEFEKFDSSLIIPGSKAVESFLDATYFLYGFVAPPRNSEDRLAIFALSSILGEGTTSQAFRKIREECGYLYSIQSDFRLYQDVGLFMFTGLTSSQDKLDLIMDALRSLFDGIQDELLSDELLATVKRNLVSNLLINLDDLYARMFRLLKHEIWFEKNYSVSDDIEYIQTITLEEISSVSERMFSGPEFLCYGT